VELEVEDINLAPIMAKHPTLLIESFISVQNLGYNDFKYGGYIEIEVELDLPI
jgi:hypothetical protein